MARTLPPGLAALVAMGLMGSLPNRRPSSANPFDDMLARLRGGEHHTEDAFAGHHPHDASAADHVEGRTGRASLDIETGGPDVMTFLIGPEGRMVDITGDEELTEAIDRMLGADEPMTDAGPYASGPFAAGGMVGPDENSRESVFSRPIFPDFGRKPSPGPGGYARAVANHQLQAEENKLLKRVFLTNIIMQLQVLQALEVPGLGPNEDDLVEDLVEFLQTIRDNFPD